MSTKICSNDEVTSVVGCSTIYAGNEAQNDILSESDESEEMIIRLDLPEENVQVSKQDDDIVIDSYQQQKENPNIVSIELKDINLDSVFDG